MDHGGKYVSARPYTRVFNRAVARAGIGLALAVTATSAVAQVRGLPVYNSGVSRGIGIAADLGFPNEAAGKGTAYDISGSAGIGLLGATATIGAYNPGGPASSNITVGGTVNYRVLGGPLIPLAVTLQGGVGYYKPDAVGQKITDLHFPIGVGFALTIPNPALAIKPWLAPRVDVARQKVEPTGVGGVSQTTTDTHFGISGGIELNFLNGVGVHAAYDLVTGTSPKPGVFGIGLHYALKVPGL